MCNNNIDKCTFLLSNNIGKCIKKIFPTAFSTYEIDYNKVDEIIPINNLNIANQSCDVKK